MKTEENYGHPLKEETPNTQDIAAVVHNGLTTAAFSALVTLEIKHQATVNRLVLATSQEILDHLYRSLQKITTRESVRDWIHLSEPRLVDDGDVMFRADTDTRVRFRPAQVDAWEAEFEAGISPRVPTFKLALPDLELNSMNIATRKGKADVIHELIDLNNLRLSSLHGDSEIVDLAWAPHSKRKRSAWLLIEFSNGQLAKQVLQQGLLWQGTIHRCRMIPIRSANPRCSRCQAYGHLDGVCFAPYCCGRCAEAHPTTDCMSPNTRCAVCGGPHPAASAKCPVRKAEHKKIRFATPEPAVEKCKKKPVKVRSVTRKARATGRRNLYPSTSNLAASPRNTNIDEEHRPSGCGGCQGYGLVAGKRSTRPRCGNCALPHSTRECWSCVAVLNGDHNASSAISPARPLGKASSRKVQSSGMPHISSLRTSTPEPHRQEPEVKLEPQPEPYLQEPEIKSEPQSPSPGVAAPPYRKTKERSMLAQVGELIQVVSKGNSREMALIKDHLETLELAMMAEDGDIVAVTPRAGKRSAQEALMSGALQDRSGSPKRVNV